jgi:hypothetical protein
MHNLRAVIGFVLLASSLAFARSDSATGSPYFATAQSSSIAAIKIRTGVPIITHGPGYDLADVMPSFIMAGPRTYYEYGGNQASWGTTTTSLSQYTGVGGGVGSNSVLSPGTGDTLKSSLTLSFPPNSIPAISPAQNTDSCGDWVTSFYKVGSTYYAWDHNEGPCNYAVGDQSNESSSIWTSSTGAPGSWSPMVSSGISNGTVVSSTEPPETHALTGFGDATMIPDNTGKYMYAYLSFYCDSSICDYHNAVARAPIRSLGPGNWTLLYKGCFCAPALNNPYNSTTKLPEADLIPWVGSSVATMHGTPFRVIATDGKGHAYWKGNPGQNIAGVGFSVSQDYITFYTFPWPLLNYDFQHFNGRPTPDDLYLYDILRNDLDGSSSLAANHFDHWVIWVPPNNSLNSRYVVRYPAKMAVMTVAQQHTGIPQVGVTLETYLNTSKGNVYSGRLRSTTVSPFAGITADGATETGWAAQTFLGYMMTFCPESMSDLSACDAVGAKVANRIEECWSSSTDDYQLHIDTNGIAGNCPSGWEHVRTAGWLYKAAQVFGTNPIEACENASSGYHYASIDVTCGGQTPVSFLGWAPNN